MSCDVFSKELSVCGLDRAGKEMELISVLQPLALAPIPSQYTVPSERGT